MEAEREREREQDREETGMKSLQRGTVGLPQEMAET